MEVVDMLLLIACPVYLRQRFIAVLVGIQIQALPFVCAAFLSYLHPVPQEGGAAARLAITVQPVFGIVMVILGTAGGLFAAGTSVFVVAVFQSAEAE